MTVKPSEIGVDKIAPGQRKSVALVYRIGDRLRLSVTAEDETINIGPDRPKP